MVPGIDPKVDFVFKRLYGTETNTALLIDLLNGVLDWPAGRRIREVELLNPFNDREYANDKLSVLDIKARDQIGRQHHVEMQLAVPFAFEKRVVYYWAKYHQQQMQESDFYQILCPTISIWWIAERMFENAWYHHRFQIWDHLHGVQLSQDLEIHTIELSKFQKKAEDIQTVMDSWCYFLKHGDSLDGERLPSTLDRLPIRKAMEVLMAVSQSERDRHRYEAQVRARQEAASLEYERLHGARIAHEQGLEEGLQRGKLEGLQEGKREGLQEGKLEGLQEGKREGFVRSIRLCQRILGVAVLSDEQAQTLDLEQLTQLANLLEQQVTNAQ